MEEYFDAAKNQVTKHIQNGMLQTITHELGTYLNVLFSILNISMNDSLIPSSVKQEYFVPFHQNMMLVLLLIQDFKDYEEILNSRGRLKIKLVKSDIKKLLFDSVKLIKTQANDKQIAINTRIASNIQNMVHIDPTKFQQILINLLSNSIKFSSEGTQIDVIMQYSQEDNERIQVLVEDQGVGMNDEEQQALKRLLSVGASEKKISKISSGYGFGLTVSNKIAVKLNEEINNMEDQNKQTQNQLQQGLHFESAGPGSRFWFFINVKKSEQISQQQQQMYQSQVSNQKRVMQTSMMLNDQLIEFENRMPLMKTISIHNDMRNADSVFIDDPSKKFAQSANPSHRLSNYENKTLSIKKSLKQSTDTLDESSSMNINPTNIPLTQQTNVTNNQLSFYNSSVGNQSPQPPPIKATSSAFSFNNLGQQLPIRRLTHDINKHQVENTLRYADDERSDLVDQLDSSDHIPPLPFSSIQDKAFDVLQIQSNNESKDKITSLVKIQHKIQDLCSQQKSELMLQSIEPPYILIVDDCSTNHYSLIIYLEKLFKIQRKQILQAYGGSQGISKVKQYQNKIKLIFMDLNMPDPDGKQSVAQIREFEKQNQLESITIVAFTAYSDPTTEFECLHELGFNYFLAKPVADPNKLKEILVYEQIISP